MEMAIVKLVVLFSARKDKGKEHAQSPGLLFKIRLLWPHLRGEGRAAVLRTVRGVFFRVLIQFFSWSGFPGAPYGKPSGEGTSSFRRKTGLPRQEVGYNQQAA